MPATLARSTSTSLGHFRRSAVAGEADDRPGRPPAPPPPRSRSGPPAPRRLARPQHDRDIEIARRRMPAAATPAASAGLLARPDHRALAARHPAASRLASSLVLPTLGRQISAEARGQETAPFIPGKSAEAAAGGAIDQRAGPQRRRTSMTTPLTAMMPFIAEPVSRSSASAGSSKYITLMMRR